MRINPFDNKKPSSRKSAPASTRIDEVALHKLGETIRGLRKIQVEYDRVIDALREARQQQRALATPQPSDISLLVERELLEAAGDAEALAVFDHEHGSALAMQRAKDEAATAQAAALPDRIVALEALARRIAARMEETISPSDVEAQAEVLLVPYARRLEETARAHADALCQINAVASTLSTRLRILEYSTSSGRAGIHRPELLGRFQDRSDILPDMVTGIAYRDIRQINDSVMEHDPETTRRFGEQLDAVGITTDALRLYIASDEGRVYIPNEPAPKKIVDDPIVPNAAYIRDEPGNPSLRTS